MGVPIALGEDHRLRLEGDLHRSGTCHRLTSDVGDAMQCLLLVPASIAGFSRSELMNFTFEHTEANVGVPCVAPLISWMLRKLQRSYRRGTPERYRLESELEAYIIRNLHRFEVPYPDLDDYERCKKVGLYRRMRVAERIVREWKVEGEIRENEEWMIDALIEIIYHMRGIDELPAPE